MSNIGFTRGVLSLQRCSIVSRASYYAAAYCSYNLASTLCFKRNLASVPVVFKTSKLERLDPSTFPAKLSLYQTAKAYLKFYKEGLKTVWSEHKMAKSALRKEAEGIKITWDEFNIVTRDKRDFKKVIPFAILVATIAELIPIMVLFFPKSLPQLVLTQKQKGKLLAKRDKRRVAMRSSLQVSSKASPGTISLSNFANKTNHIIVYNKYPESFNIDNLDRKTLQLANGFFGLSKIGLSSGLRTRLLRHLQTLEKDDKLLLNKRISDMTKSQIIDSCDARGIPTTNFQVEKLAKSLESWVEFRASFPNASPGLILWSRIFTLSKIPSTT